MKTLSRFLMIIMIVGLTSQVCAYKLTNTKWATADMPVAWKTNTAGSADLGLVTSQAALQSAFDTWEATASYITFTDAGTTASTNWGALDYTNLMVWVESGWTTKTGMSSGVIGVCQYWYSGGRTLDSDIAFNGANYTWSATGEAGKMDAQNLAAHEIGHLLGLADLYSGADTLKTMYGYASNGETKKRSLHQDDINGINAVYPVGYPIVAYDPNGAYTWNNADAGSAWTDVAVGDFDGDGDEEIAVIRNTRATWGNMGYPIMISDPGGEMTWSNTDSGTPWSNITAGDFDGDGDDEIAVIRTTRATWGSGGYPIMVFDPGGEMTWSNTASGFQWMDIAAGDFDGDGDDELVVIRDAKATWGSYGCPILIVDPGGEMTWDNTLSGFPWSRVTAGDFDGDGDDEVAVIRNSPATWGSRGYPIVVFDPGGEMTWDNTSSGSSWSDLTAGDFDGDGNEEIAVIRNSAATWGSLGYPILVVDPGSELSWSNTNAAYPWSKIAAGNLDGANSDAEITVISNYRASW